MPATALPAAKPVVPTFEFPTAWLMASMHLNLLSVGLCIWSAVCAQRRKTGVRMTAEQFAPWMTNQNLIRAALIRMAARGLLSWREDRRTGMLTIDARMCAERL